MNRQEVQKLDRGDDRKTKEEAERRRKVSMYWMRRAYRRVWGNKSDAEEIGLHGNKTIERGR